jgi:hypothetical protein
VTVTFIFHTPRRISLQAEDPAAASGSGQITTESGSIHSLVWLLTYSAFLLPHNTASTLSEPGQSLIRFGRVPGAKTSLFPWQPQPFYVHQPVRGIRKHAQCAGVSGFSSAVASGQKAHSKRALPHGRQQIPHAVAGHDELRMATSRRRAVRRRCPVRVWLSLRRLRLRLEYLEVSFNPRFGRDQIRRRAFRCGRFRQGVCGALKFLVVAWFPGLGLGCPLVSKGCEATREWPSCCLRTTVSP